MKIHPVIIAGGGGTRLWPLSRSTYPKQFLSLLGESSMLIKTIQRLDGLDISDLTVICNEEHRFIVAEQLRLIEHRASIVLEPFGKNTAPAVGLASFLLDPQELVLVLSSDHFVRDAQKFTDDLLSAIPLALENKIVTFGAKPDRPHTGYGYIKKGAAFFNGHLVEKFVEKPKLEIAEKYLADDRYFWNTGIFMFRAGVFLEELNRYEPAIYRTTESAIEKSVKEMDYIRVNEEEFAKCPSNSIDFAVMEKTEHAAMIELNTDWSDVGSWNSLWEISEKDEYGNVEIGDVYSLHTQNSYMYSDSRLLVVLGLSNIVAVDTKDAILLAKSDQMEEMATLVNKIRSLGKSEVELHREVHRPWGKYDSIERGSGFQIKLITVAPGQKLSIQSHNKRNEYWVVVKGIAHVTKGEDEFVLNKNEGIYIPARVIHALANEQTEDLVLVEVQTGDYLEEDDIVRYQDRYGRVN